MPSRLLGPHKAETEPRVVGVPGVRIRDCLRLQTFQSKCTRDEYVQDLPIFNLVGHC